MNRKSVVSGLLALATICVLMVPAIAGYTADITKENLVLTQGATQSTSVGFVNAAGSLNETQLNATYTQDLVLWESSADTMIMSATSGDMAYVNSITTVTNDNAVVWNYSDTGETTQSENHDFDLYIALDKTTYDIIENDFMVLLTDMAASSVVPTYSVGYISDGVMQKIPAIKSANGTYNIIFSMTESLGIYSSPDSDLYLIIEDANPSDEIFEFSLETRDLSTALWNYDDIIILDFSIIIGIGVLICLIALNTETFDMVIRRK